MNITSKHMAILVDDYFEQSEFEEPIDALEIAGAEVTVISAGDSTELQDMRHISFADKFTADLLLNDARIEDYDALVLPGGVINSDNLRMNEKAQSSVVDFMDQGKLVAAICHAPWLLISADVVEGKQLTSFPTLQDDIRNAGGEWTDQPAVIDNNLVTSRKPDDLSFFNEAIISWYAKEPAVV